MNAPIAETETMMIGIQHGYCRLYNWYVRRGDKLVFVSRRDDYDLKGNLIKRGEVIEGAALDLNGWTYDRPPGQ